MDSYGWLQFKLGNTEKALDYLQQAYEKQQENEIAAHLAEVLWALGRKDEAKKLFNKAIKDAPDDEYLLDFQRRILNGAAIVMLSIKVKWLGWWCLVFMLSACSIVPVEPEVHYSRIAREHLYELERWSFEGRLALTGKNDSWSASINWGHSPDDEKIKLSGPLGQGATVIQLTGNLVTIDRGG